MYAKTAKLFIGPRTYPGSIDSAVLVGVADRVEIDWTPETGVTGAGGQFVADGPAVLRALLAFYPEVVAKVPGAEGLPGTCDQVVYVNLISELFAQPFGLGFLLPEGDDHAAWYCDDVMFKTLSININNACTFVIEGAKLESSRLVAVES